MKFPKLSVACLLLFTTFSIAANAPALNNIFYNVKDYWAKGDGTTLDTKNINASIDADFVIKNSTGLKNTKIKNTNHQSL